MEQHGSPRAEGRVLTNDARALSRSGEACPKKCRQRPRVLRRAYGLVRFAQATVGASATSLFLADDSGATLRGLVGEWDWVRTSFAAKLKDWPTVELSFLDGESRTITRREALGHEAVWFEPRGIASTVCVPLGSAPDDAVGVLFFDFESDVVQADPDGHRRFLADVGHRIGRALKREPGWRTRGETYVSAES